MVRASASTMFCKAPHPTYRTSDNENIIVTILFSPTLQASITTLSVYRYFWRAACVKKRHENNNKTKN